MSLFTTIHLTPKRVNHLSSLMKLDNGHYMIVYVPLHPPTHTLTCTHSLTHSLVQVCNILTKLPKLSFLDLSHNELDSSSVLEVVSEAEQELAFDQLKTLVLNCTHFDWSALQECLKMLPK